MFKALSLVFCLANFAACGGGGGGEGGSSGVDATVPSVSINSPANNATVSGPTTVTASASDNVGVSKVEFYVNNALQVTDNSAPYSFDWNTLPLAKGSYTLTARAYDAADNVQQSAVVAVTVPVSTSMNTVVSGTTAVGTVTLYGLPVPDAYGLDFLVTMPPGASIDSVASSGSYAATGLSFLSGPTAVTHASSNVGSGEIMVINFAVPAGRPAASFNISLTAVFDGGGVVIQ